MPALHSCVPSPDGMDAVKAAVAPDSATAAAPSCDWCDNPRAHARTNLCAACLEQFWTEAYDLADDIGRGSLA